MKTDGIENRNTNGKSEVSKVIIQLDNPDIEHLEVTVKTCGNISNEESNDIVVDLIDHIARYTRKTDD